MRILTRLGLGDNSGDCRLPGKVARVRARRLRHSEPRAQVPSLSIWSRRTSAPVPPAAARRSWPPTPVSGRLRGRRPQQRACAPARTPQSRPLRAGRRFPTSHRCLEGRQRRYGSLGRCPMGYQGWWRGLGHVGASPAFWRS